VADEPTINPYAPPASDVAGAPAQAATDGPAFEHPLFSPKQILAAVFFGTVVAGIILLQANFRAMNRPGDAKKTVLYGALASVVLFGVLLVLPEGVPTIPINIGIVFGFYALANSLQGAAFRDHRAAGGERQSHGLVFGIILGTGVTMAVILFLLARVVGSPGT
jgi:hypothetical protein